jgi:hypothetical protein
MPMVASQAGLGHGAVVTDPGPALASHAAHDVANGKELVIDREVSSPIHGGSVGGVPSPPTPPVLPSVDSSQATLRSSPPPSPTAVPVMATHFVTPTRHSGRFGTTAEGASVTDEDSMIWAMCMKAELNLDYSGMVTPSKAKSFLSFSTLDINSKLGNVGVKIGSCGNDIIVSSNILRRMEVDRLMLTPKVSAFSSTTYFDDEEAIDSTDGRLLSQLIGEVSDVIFDEARLSSLYEFKASGRKSRSCSGKKGKMLKKRTKVSPSAIISR